MRTKTRARATTASSTTAPLLALVCLGCTGATQNQPDDGAPGVAESVPPSAQTDQEAVAATQDEGREDEGREDEGREEAEAETGVAAPVTAEGQESAALEQKYADAEPEHVINGRATYYANLFEGRKTYSGDVYQHDEMTAASKDLPMGSVVRVVRADTEDAVLVEVNDRIPQDKGSTIDLSQAAAKQLDMMEEGIVPVRIEVLHRP